MPTYDSIITRSEAAALIPEEVSAEILQNVPQRSVCMQLGTRLPNMSRAQMRLPVLSALPVAYFVTGDYGLKQTTEVNWDNKYVTAEEIAAIVPIPEAVLDDADYDIWGQVRPLLEEALGVVIDNAVLWGTNIPSSWTTDLGAAGIQALCAARSHQISAAAYADLYEAILGENSSGDSGLFGLVEDDGFTVTGCVAYSSMKRKLRNVRTTEGQPIFTASMQQPNQYTLDGAPCIFPETGVASSTYPLVVGAWKQLVYAMRQDITYKVLDQAVIQDGSGAIQYNLAQQDMVALRVVMRVGFALPNPINRMQPTEANRCPFAVLTA